MGNGYVSGADAIDLARMSGLQLNRVPCKVDDVPDTSWEVADKLIAEGVDPEEFFMDLDRLTVEQAGHVILCLVGMSKALHDYSRMDRNMLTFVRDIVKCADTFGDEDNAKQDNAVATLTKLLEG